MRIFCRSLCDSDEAALFFGFDSSKGWLYIDDQGQYDKVYVVDEMAFCPEVQAIHSQPTDLVLEEEDLVCKYRNIKNYEDCKILKRDIYERIENGGCC